MNTFLKLSWAHIFAFIALFFIAYSSFIGISWRFEWGTFGSVCASLGIGLLLAFLFIGAQYCKGRQDDSFDRYIKYERVLLFLSFVFYFFVLMFPFYHYCTIIANRDDITKVYKEEVNGINDLFNQYEDQSNGRVTSYGEMLGRAIDVRETHPEDFEKCGFRPGMSVDACKKNMINTLRMQLLGANYTSLKVNVDNWKKGVDENPTTANPRLLSNIKTVDEALTEYTDSLQSMYSPHLENEESDGFNPDVSIKDIHTNVVNIETKYGEFESPSLVAILCAIIGWVCLMLPYWVQDRSTKANGLYSVVPSGVNKLLKKSVKKKVGDSASKQAETDKDSDDNYGPFYFDI